jgi:hypothetical protein
LPGTCNPSYLGGWDWEDYGSRPAQANSSQDFISQIIRTKWAESVVQVVECLLCKHEILSSNPNPTKKKKNVIIHKKYKIFYPGIQDPPRTAPNLLYQSCILLLQHDSNLKIQSNQIYTCNAFSCFCACTFLFMLLDNLLALAMKKK